MRTNTKFDISVVHRVSLIHTHNFIINKEFKYCFFKFVSDADSKQDAVHKAIEVLSSTEELSPRGRFSMST